MKIEREGRGGKHPPRVPELVRIGAAEQSGQNCFYDQRRSLVVVVVQLRIELEARASARLFCSPNRTNKIRCDGVAPILPFVFLHWPLVFLDRALNARMHCVRRALDAAIPRGA